MASIKDDRGYNQGFAPARSTTVRMQRRTDLLLSEMDPAPDKSILEIGCGTGEVSYWMAQKTPARVLGTDLCVPFIAEAAQNYQLPNLAYEVVDMNQADPLQGRQFDYVVGNGILHHLYYNLDEVLAGMRRLLKQNGKIIFMEPNYHNPYVFLIFSVPFLRRAANLEPGEMALSKRFITKKLKSAGFTHIEVEYKDFLLPGIPDFFIQPSIVAGDLVERIPLARHLSQSLFIRGTNA